MTDAAGQSAHPGASTHDTTASGNFWALALGSIGVVYGDIGTSPLYAFREAVHAASGAGPVTRETAPSRASTTGVASRSRSYGGPSAL